MTATPTPPIPPATPAQVRLRVDRNLIRTAANSLRHVLVELAAPSVPRRATRTPVNLGFVLDRSGSMTGAKLAVAKRAIAEAIGRLEPDDRFCIVVYDDVIDIVAESLEAPRIDASMTSRPTLVMSASSGSGDTAAVRYNRVTHLDIRPGVLPARPT
jgi:cobalamin biosynthesis protein CobT